MAQWYFADTPGETSSMDQNRLPKLLYYVYEAAWTPFTIKPVVHLAGHWNFPPGMFR
jgi:beta-galactosidase